MLNALAILLVFQLAGEVLVQWLALPVPGPLVGMLMLFAVMLARSSLPDALRATTNAILQHLMLLFIPAVTGVIVYFDRVGGEWLPFVVAGVGGAAITMAVTAVTFRLMLARRKRSAE